LGDIRETALSGADGTWTDGHLSAERDTVMRRIAALERPAEIIAFPGATRRLSVVPRRSHRWIAAAAVVGLMAGLAAGRLLHVHPSDLSRTARIGAAPVDAPAQAQTATSSELAFNDEALLLEIDTALHGHGIAELYALDALTLNDASFDSP
jgi:hypothetical protein